MCRKWSMEAEFKIGLVLVFLAIFMKMQFINSAIVLLGSVAKLEWYFHKLFV